MTRFAKSVPVVLLALAATLGTAAAQGRGRGGSSGASGSVIRGGATYSNARGGAPPAQRGGTGPAARPPIATPPVARPPIATPRPPLNWKNSGPSPSHYGVGRQRQVFIGSPYPDYYGSYGYPSFYSAFPYVSYSDSYYSSSAQSQIQTDLANQVELLTREVEQMRQDQANLLSQIAQASSPSQRPPEAPAAPITLVFRDGHRLNIQNYAIVRGSLWALDEFMSTRIPLNDLDLDATRLANPGRTLLLPTEPGR